MAASRFHSNSKTNSTPGLGLYQQLRREIVFTSHRCPATPRATPKSSKSTHGRPAAPKHPVHSYRLPVSDSQSLTPTSMPRTKIFKNQDSNWLMENIQKCNLPFAAGNKIETEYPSRYSLASRSSHKNAIAATIASEHNSLTNTQNT